MNRPGGVRVETGAAQRANQAFSYRFGRTRFHGGRGHLGALPRTTSSQCDPGESVCINTARPCLSWARGPPSPRRVRPRCVYLRPLKFTCLRDRTASWLRAALTAGDNVRRTEFADGPPDIQTSTLADRSNMRPSTAVSWTAACLPSAGVGAPLWCLSPPTSSLARRCANPHRTSKAPSVASGQTLSVRSARRGTFPRPRDTNSRAIP